MLPHMDAAAAQALVGRKLQALPQLLMECRSQPQRALKTLEQALGSAKRAQECAQAGSFSHLDPDPGSAVGRQFPASFPAADWRVPLAGLLSPCAMN